MTIVHGQIETLTRIKGTLYQNGISRFNSTGEISDFIKNYEVEKQGVLHQSEKEINLELEGLKAKRIKFQTNFNKLTAKNTIKFNEEINQLQSKYDLIESRTTTIWVIKQINRHQLKKVNPRKQSLKIIFINSFMRGQSLSSKN